ncbi:MAG: M23 family metallopeptidase [Bacteroidota bacterium]|nr:M23 family metallopeptidase [Bacteroidota bacterium]
MQRYLWITLFFSFAFKFDDGYPPKPIAFSLNSPVRHPISLTGSFGELRNNHFHAGIDIRSNHSGNPCDILAAAEGFVKKITIDADNYGKSMLIEHPGGYTTLYAHLLRFRSDIEARIKNEQYSRKTFELEIEFGPNEFPVAAAEMVAYMGNTGSSRGTHLHFELRKTGTQVVLDPFEYGVPIEDKLSPVLKRLKIYGFDIDGNVSSESIIGKKQLSLPNMLVKVPGDIMGIGVDAMDQTNNSWNWIGIKSIQLIIDGGIFYHFSTDKWSLEDTKYINAHIDYKSKVEAKGQFHRCFLISGNKIPLYKTVQNDGLFYIGDSTEHNVQLIIADANGNKTEHIFKVIKNSFTKIEKGVSGDHHIHADEAYKISGDSYSFTFPQACLYENLDCKITTTANLYSNSFSDWFAIYPDKLPLHQPIKISLKPKKSIPDSLRDKCFIAVGRGKSIVSCGGKWAGEYLESDYKYLGKYAILIDTIAPKISPYTFKKDLSKSKSFIFRISDNIPALGTNQGLKYDAYIDGHWILMEHDAKSHSIKHSFEEWLSKGTHDLLVVAKDDLGNTREYRSTFYR